MRIAFDAKRLFNNFTGLGNYSRTLVKDLAQTDSESKWFLCADRLQQNERTVPFFNRVDYQLIRPPKKELLWRQFGITEDLKQNQIQLYHGLSNELPLGLKAAGIKQIVTIHDLLFYQFKEDFPWLDRQIYDWKFSSACAKADKIIAISEHTRGEIMDKYGIESDKIEVIYQSCDTQFFKPVGDEDMNRAIIEYNLPSQYMLYVGTLNSRKNALTILEALQQMSAADRLPLVIVGDGGEYKQKLLQYVSTHSLDKWIHWIPKLDFALLPAIYKSASLFIFPSKGEGFGIPVLEAQAVGIPVITSNCSSLKEVGGMAAALIDPTNAAELRHAIESILIDCELAKIMVERGKQNLLKFDRKNATEKVLSLYKSTLALNR